ncbi:8-oxoguanine deaminase [Clostridium sp. C105KSO15]|nr:8-oxoguanine deaminase [Clostridium sp. C105KSO15]
MPSLVGSEMCIRDRLLCGAERADRVMVGGRWLVEDGAITGLDVEALTACLLYTSDAADDLLCGDLGGRRIIKKKKDRNRGGSEQRKTKGRHGQSE